MNSQEKLPAWADNTDCVFTQMGSEVRLLGRKNVTQVFARRISDGCVRVFDNATLRAPRGASQLEGIIARLPTITLKAIKHQTSNPNEITA